MDEIAIFYRRLGQRVRIAREAAGMTQDGLALALGLQRTSVTNIEQGRQHILVHTLVRIANTLGVSYSDLLSPALADEMAQEIPAFQSLDPQARRWVEKVVAPFTSQEKQDGRSIQSSEAESSRTSQSGGSDRAASAGQRTRQERRR